MTATNTHWSRHLARVRSGPSTRRAPANWDARELQRARLGSRHELHHMARAGSPKRVGDNPSRRGPDNGSALRRPHGRQAVGRADPLVPTSLGTSVKLTNSGGAQNYVGYLGVGPRSSFVVGDFAVLRFGAAGRNYSLVCDPRFDQPSTTDMEAAFYFGCEPPYTYNSLTSRTATGGSPISTGDGETDCPLESRVDGSQARHTRTAHGSAFMPIPVATDSELQTDCARNGKLSKPRHR